MHAPNATPRSPWIVSPSIDLLIGCGGWTVLLAGTVAAATRAGIDVAPAFYALALVCNYPHYMATVVRAYGDPAVRDRHRLHTVYLTLLLGFLAVASVWSSGLARALVTAYLTWSPWHYTGQNFGLALLLAQRAGLRLAPHERRLLRVSFVAGFALWILWMQSTPATNPDLFSLAVPAAVSIPIRVTLLITCALCSVLAAGALLRRGRAGVAPCVLLVTQALWFVAPTILPPSPSTAGVLAFAHCAQYLWVASYAARRSTPTASSRGYAAGLVVGGAALFLLVPWIASWMFPVDLARTLVTVAAVVNLHHFLIDGVIWKLRDPAVSRLLVASKATAPPSAEPRWGWWAPLRVAVAVGVLLIAGLDQAQYLGTREHADAAALVRAAARAPHDTRVLVRRAEGLMAVDDVDGALALVDHALSLDPLCAGALRARGAILVHAGRFAEAAAHYDVAERRINPDLGTLVNGGVLAARVGDLARARDRFTRALALDPTSAEAHLNLAEVAVLAHDPSTAAVHFRSFLETIDQAGLPDERHRVLAEAVRRKLAAAEAQLSVGRR